jgi:hypothetical protein
MVAGYPARCLDVALSASSTDYRVSACYFLIAGNLFESGYIANNTYWQQSFPILNDIIASLELRPI